MADGRSPAAAATEYSSPYADPRYRQLRERKFDTEIPRCANCGTIRRIEVDHVHELHDGGDAFDPANTQFLCRACNVRKHKDLLRGGAHQFDSDGNMNPTQAGRRQGVRFLEA